MLRADYCNFINFFQLRRKPCLEKVILIQTTQARQVIHLAVVVVTPQRVNRHCGAHRICIAQILCNTKIHRIAQILQSHPIKD